MIALCGFLDRPGWGLDIAGQEAGLTNLLIMTPQAESCCGCQTCLFGGKVRVMLQGPQVCTRTPHSRPLPRRPTPALAVLPPPKRSFPFLGCCSIWVL